MSGFVTAVIPVGQTLSSTDPSYPRVQENLGHVYKAKKGEVYVLVQATNADGVTGQKKVYIYTDRAARTVELDTGVDTQPAGVQPADQKGLLAGDLFYLQVGGRATCVDSGAGVTAGDQLEGTATGDVVTDATPTDSSHVLGTAAATVGAGLDVEVDLAIQA